LRLIQHPVFIQTCLFFMASESPRVLPATRALLIQLGGLTARCWGLNWRRSSATFVLGDYHKLDFGEFDAVFAYLSPAAMPAADKCKFKPSG